VGTPVNLWWVRRDLRLSDNQALQAALRQGAQVVPVFVLDPALLQSRYMAEKRLAFLLAGLRNLDNELRLAGSRLVVRYGPPEEELERLVNETGASSIIAEPDYSPYASQRDHAIARRLPVEWAGSPAALPPGLVVKSDGSPYTVFTPFSRAWKDIYSPQPSRALPAPVAIQTPLGLESLPIPHLPALPAHVPFPASSQEARRRLEAFTSGLSPAVYRYAAGRDRQDLTGTSQLSPYLRFGMISARQAVLAAGRAIQSAEDAEARKGAETWLNELIWRDFYIHILYHFPQVRRQNFRLPDVRWENNPTHFQAWCAGLTGYPGVDAAMRQLVQSGWMHNRSRMLVASFLTKDLLVDWRKGEQFFMQHLVDGDPASNNGGWQWTAGTGTDAAPYFRIFNPTSQSMRHDPQGSYIRRWLPELEGVPDEYIHQPWLMPQEIQQKSACILGHDYPYPIIDHAEARQRALKAYGKPT
jgi:deoxyribodipyrimidine photo-lyase